MEEKMLHFDKRRRCGAAGSLPQSLSSYGFIYDLTLYRNYYLGHITGADTPYN